MIYASQIRSEQVMPGLIKFRSENVMSDQEKIGSNQEESGQGRSTQAKSGQIRSYHVKAMSRSDQIRSCQSKVRSGQDRSGHVRLSIRASQVR